eukprot:171322_1
MIIQIRLLILALVIPPLSGYLYPISRRFSFLDKEWWESGLPDVYTNGFVDDVTDLIGTSVNADGFVSIGDFIMIGANYTDDVTEIKHLIEANVNPDDSADIMDLIGIGANAYSYDLAGIIALVSIGARANKDDLPAINDLVNERFNDVYWSDDITDINELIMFGADLTDALDDIIHLIRPTLPWISPINHPTSTPTSDRVVPSLDQDS